MWRALVLASWLASPMGARAQDCDDPALTMAAAEALTSPGAVDPLVLARAAGSTLPVVRGLRTRDGNDAGVRRFVDSLAELTRAPIACGEARSGGRLLVLAGPRAAALDIVDGVAVVELANGWTSPRLYVRDGSGHPYEGPFEGGRAEVPSDLEPPLLVQVVATGPDGPRPVAERRVGEVRAVEVARSDEPIPDRVRRLRDQSQVGPLRENRLLTRVAQRHAAQVCREGRVAHLGEGGDPVERLAREGVLARHVGETVARADDLADAYAAMLQSPSHRAALVDRRMTDVGVGSAGGRCLVVLLAAWPRAVPYQPR